MEDRETIFQLHKLEVNSLLTPTQPSYYLCLLLSLQSGLVVLPALGILETY